MHRCKITDMTIQTVTLPTQGRTFVWDNGSPLGLQISATGVKSFVVILGRRRKTIGQYGHITLQQARTAAKQLKAEHTLGRLVPSSRSLSDARDEYLKAITIRANTRRYYERNLHRLPDIRLTEVSAADLNRVLDVLPPPARGQALKTFSAFFRWCIRRHYLDTSPCIRFKADQATTRDRVLTDDEVRAVWNASMQLGEWGCMIRLCLLTGQRRGELSNPSLVVIRQSSLTIPARLAKNNKEHSIPLSPTSIKLFQNLTGPVGKRDDLKIRLDELSGVTGWVVHDCRRTVASGLQKCGVRPEVIEAILNHAKPGVVGVYQKYDYFPEMVDAFTKWESRLQEIVGN